jgi:hypothetical protein
MKVSALDGRHLEYWAACSHNCGERVSLSKFEKVQSEGFCRYLSQWELAGALIEKFGINTRWLAPENGRPALWHAEIEGTTKGYTGKTLREAAMRAFVALEYGDNVPDDYSYYFG